MAMEHREGRARAAAAAAATASGDASDGVYKETN